MADVGKINDKYDDKVADLSQDYIEELISLDIAKDQYGLLLKQWKIDVDVEFDKEEEEA